MFESLLVTTSSEGLKPLGTPAQRSFELVTGTVRQSLGDGAASIFAEPVATQHGDRFDWYAPWPGVATPLDALGPEERAAAEAVLEGHRAEIGALAARLRGGRGGADDDRLAEALSNALEVPDAGYVHVFAPEVAGGPPRPVLVNWAWVADHRPTERGRLTGLTPGRAAAAAAPAARAAAPAMVAAEPATAPETERRRGVPGWLLWLGWPLLLLMIATILWLMIAPCGLRGLAFLDRCPAPPAARLAAFDREAQLTNEIAALERRIGDAGRLPPPARADAGTRGASRPAGAPPQDRGEIDERLERAGAQRGDMSFSLAWDGLSDLDLYVSCPGGQRISYQNRVACRGTLDVDANVNDSDARPDPVENIFFTDPAPGGYQLRVNLYGSREGGAEIPFRVQIRDGDHTETREGTVSATRPNWQDSYDLGERAMIEDRRRRLRAPAQWREEVTLTPYSGIQILDFGFRLDTLELKPARFIERVLGEQDGQIERELLSLTGVEEVDDLLGVEDGDEPYSVRPSAALDPFLGKWVPAPVLRLKSERGSGGEERYDSGPSSWARIRTVELDAPDPDTGHTHRVQLAIDTTLIARNQERHYVAPERADAEKTREFRFVADRERMGWFLRRPEVDEHGREVDVQLWVSDWLREIFLAFKRAERPGRTITEEQLPHRFEHWARYLAYLRLIDHAVSPPKLRFVNTVADRDSVAPVDVDLVLDVGNSRTCGILIERFPGESRVDLARSFPLEIRDLSRPEFIYSGLIESRVEFSELRFGDDRYASRSGRRNAFVWPGFVRVGPEALRLIQGEDGTQTMSGLSSPKRYLWDDTPTQQDWRFQNHFDPNNLPRGVRAAMQYLNESGDVLEQVSYEVGRRLRKKDDKQSKRAIRPRFSRSALFSFMLAEIIAHALVQINDPASRARRAQSDLPRRLARVILTLPTATSAQEQAIIRSRAGGALRLVWSLLGVGETDSSISRRPELLVEWDEASCTQLVYLYSELTQKFDGRIDTFLGLKGRPRVRPGTAAPEPSLRLACVDIGGGTTDLMITTYWGEANRVLHPSQTFREGFRIAGDDLIQRVVSAIVLPAIQDSIAAAGGRYVAERVTELFGGDIGGQDQQQTQKRRQFALRVLVPLAVAILERCETAGEFDRIDIPATEVLGPLDGTGPGAPAGELIDYIERPAADIGAIDWRLADLVMSTAREDIDAIARDTFQKALGNMSEVIDHLGVDVVLLTGRPSRLPAVRAIVEEMLVVPPHRLISMHRYRTGHWYPFRDPITQRIGDPKSTVAVGGMLIALSANRIPNFRVATDAFQMRSTARFVGEMDSNGQITAERVMFSDLDLDTRPGAAAKPKVVKMFAPIHIGCRQLPLERWTTTPLFRLDFANVAAQKRPTPISITVEKADFDDEETESSEERLRREALREAFAITEVEDASGDGRMKIEDISLRLQTLGFEDDYWIDTGVFRL